MKVTPGQSGGPRGTEVIVLVVHGSRRSCCQAGRAVRGGAIRRVILCIRY